MLKFIKNNKIISILIFLSLISMIFGLLFNAFLGEDIKNTITNNINNLLGEGISQNILFSHLFSTLFLFILGISIIGFIFILALYLFNLFITTFEGVSLIINLGIKNIILIILYLVPNIIYLISLFILCLYSISYSFCLFRVLFRGKNYNLRLITKKYFKIFIICIILVILSNILEFIILPRLKIIKF